MLEKLTLLGAVKYAIKLEDLSALAYATLSTKFSDDKNLSNLFQVLSREEAAHSKALTTLVRKVPDNDGGIEQDRWLYLRAISISFLISAHDGLLSRVEGVKTQEDAIMRSIGIEKATLQYIVALGEVLGESDLLASVVRAEKRHVVNLMRYVVSNSKQLKITEETRPAPAAQKTKEDDPPKEDPPPPTRKDNITFG